MNVSEIDAGAARPTDRPVLDVVRKRWSPRAMSGEEIPEDELMSLFEAARWAPSSYNSQPWRFIYARRGTPAFETFLGFLMEANREWCVRAAALVVILSRTRHLHNDKPNGMHTFDTGAAWENFAIEGTARGLVVHGMAGFDFGKAKAQLGIPDLYEVQAMAAVGRPGNVEDLPAGLRDKEIPSDRLPLAKLVAEGAFREG